MRVILTAHARMRMRERGAAANKKIARRCAEAALRKGIRHRETDGDLRSYVSMLYLKHWKGDNIRIWQGYVYIFRGKTLITVFALPEMFRAEAEKIQKRKKGTYEIADAGR